MLPGLVSIIIPNFNKGGMLLEAIRSCLNQQGVDVEVILVDDGSTDGSGERAKELFPGLKYVAQKNQGACVARNRGMEEARGEFIKFLDSDDLLAPQILKNQVECLLRTGADVVYGDFEMFGNLNDKRIMRKTLRITGAVLDPVDALLGDWWCAPFSYLYRAGSLLTARWREDLPCLQDFDFILRVALEGRKFVYDKGVSGYYRIHSGQITNSSGLTYAQSRCLILDDVVSVLKKDHPLTRKRRNLIANGYWSAARTFYRSDKERFEELKNKIDNLAPHFFPKLWEPLPVKALTFIFGIRYAERLLALVRSLMGRSE